MEAVEQEPEEAEEEGTRDEVASLELSEVGNRLIRPEERLLTGRAMALYEFMPTKDLQGMEDFVEESEYYDSYTKVISLRCSTVNFTTLPHNLRPRCRARRRWRCGPSPPCSSPPTCAASLRGVAT